MIIVMAQRQPLRMHTRVKSTSCINLCESNSVWHEWIDVKPTIFEGDLRKHGNAFFSPPFHVICVMRTVAVPTFPSPPPKNKRNVSEPSPASGRWFAEDKKITFLRSPTNGQVGSPSHSVSKSNVGTSSAFSLRCKIRVGSWPARMTKPAV